MVVTGVQLLLILSVFSTAVVSQQTHVYQSCRSVCAYCRHKETIKQWYDCEQHCFDRCLQQRQPGTTRATENERMVKTTEAPTTTSVVTDRRARGPTQQSIWQRITTSRTTDAPTSPVRNTKTTRKASGLWERIPDSTTTSSRSVTKERVPIATTSTHVRWPISETTTSRTSRVSKPNRRGATPLRDATRNDDYTIPQANDRLIDCCDSIPRLTHGCRQLCSHQRFTSAAIQAAILNGYCQSEDVQRVYACVSGGVDHTSCCREKEITKKCTTVCDGSKYKPKPSPTLSECVLGSEFATIKQCFYKRDEDCAVNDIFYEDTCTEGKYDWQELASKKSRTLDANGGRRRAANVGGRRRPVAPSSELDVPTMQGRRKGIVGRRRSTSETETKGMRRPSSGVKDGRRETTDVQEGRRRHTDTTTMTTTTPEKKSLTPNQHVMQCCMANMGQPSNGCMSFCSYAGLTKQAIIDAVLWKTCPVSTVSATFQCVARQTNHAACCRRKRVSGVCLDLCDGTRKPDFTMKYMRCLDSPVLPAIKQCFREYTIEHPVFAEPDEILKIQALTNQ